MAQQFVSADSKGFMGALSPLMSISFELHKIGAVLRNLKSALERGWTGRGEANSKSSLELTQLDSTEVIECQ